MFDLQDNIKAWSDHLRVSGKMQETDVYELEEHLREEMAELREAGLSDEEAFIISVKRVGNLNELTHEYSKINIQGFWKQLLIEKADKTEISKNQKNIMLVIVFSLLAGTLFKLPEWLGFYQLFGSGDLFYLKNLSLFILPFVAVYFLITKKAEIKNTAIILALFLFAAIVVNVYPSYSPNDTALLTSLHLPLFLWLVCGAAYIGKSFKESKARMDFIRFTGEAFIYGCLIFLGIIVLAFFIVTIFETINIDLSWFTQQYVFVYGACAAMMITVYLVEAKKSIVENFAPILAKIFSPLFLIAMLVFLGEIVIVGKSPFAEREFLIGFDFMLILVLGLVLYIISSRGMHDSFGYYDYMNMALIATAIIIDSIALSAIIFRLSAYGISPNKLAALGENLAVLFNLLGFAVLYVQALRKKIQFSDIEKWQTAYLNVYALWLAFVAFAFPIIFAFK